MNSVVKNMLLIVIPSAISAVASHFITKKIITAKYEAEMEVKIKDEINKFKKDYMEKMSTEVKRIPVSQLSNEQKEKMKISIEREEKRRKAIEKRREEEMKNNYKEIDEEEIVSPMEEDIGDDTDSDGEDLYDEDGNLLGDPNDDEDDNGTDVIEDDEDIPFIITQEEFDTDDNYEKSSIMYYEDDKVLANTSDYILDIDEIIGRDALNHFGDMSNDATIVYVRNKAMNADYEVQLVHGSFKHLVGEMK
ncbi:MAG: hypothetical protein IJ094_13100 [Bacilli bacterium]|nr:hypothetical protein [Bacilli bacterium]